MPASAASMIASAANGGGTKITEALAPVFATASATVSKTGTPSTDSPPLPGVTPATTRVPYSRHLPGVEGAGLAGDALDDHLGVLVDENAHSRQLHDLLGAVGHVGRRR
jgi:hypothetical protein